LPPSISDVSDAAAPQALDRTEPVPDHPRQEWGEPVPNTVHYVWGSAWEAEESRSMENVIWAHCNRCGQGTNHDLIGIDKQENDVDAEYELYEMLRCRGCNTVTMRHTDTTYYTDHPRIVYYPPVIARRAPDWVTGVLSLYSDVIVPEQISALMREIYTAVQNDSRRLVAMGIRTVVEIVMIEKVGERNNFKLLVDAFQNAGYLSLRQAGTLDSILEVGHAAIHRGWEPK
jgi:hypothetical protein